MHKRNLSGPRKELSAHLAGAVQRHTQGPVRHDLFKRGIDILAALVAIAFVSPLLLVCALWVWADFGTWPFARLMYVGQYGRQFRLLTFRTGAETTTSDQLAGARKSAIGQVLTISNLDRLPVLLNLLHGNLSLVGPRPLSSEDHQYYAARIPGYIYREQIKPGLFGWAQLHDRGNSMDIRRQIQLDIWYAQNQSLRLDLRVMRLSLQRMMLGQG